MFTPSAAPPCSSPSMLHCGLFVHSWYWINSGIRVLCICSQDIAGVVEMPMAWWVCPPGNQVSGRCHAWGTPSALSKVFTPPFHRGCFICVHFICPSPQGFSGWSFPRHSKEDQRHLIQSGPQCSYPEGIFVWTKCSPLHLLFWVHATNLLLDHVHSRITSSCVFYGFFYSALKTPRFSNWVLAARLLSHQLPSMSILFFLPQTP